MKFSLIVLFYFLLLPINNNCLANSDKSISMYDIKNKFNDSKGEKNIVGGFYAQMGWYPYQVALFDSQLIIVKVFNCGGSIIGYNYVLTAAHCLVGKSTVTVVAGITSVSKFGGAMQKRKSKRLVPHEGYHHELKDSLHDIGLVVTEEPFFYSAFIKAIPLPTRKPKVGEYCVTSGWGAIDKDRKDYPEFLRALFVPINDPKICKKWYSQFFEGMICSGFVEGKDFCFGDSGGPLSCRNELQGVVSYFLPRKAHICATGGANVYTYVAHYKDWIRNHTFQFRSNNGRTISQINAVYLFLLVIVGNCWYLNIALHE